MPDKNYTVDAASNVHHLTTPMIRERQATGLIFDWLTIQEERRHDIKVQKLDSWKARMLKHGKAHTATPGAEASSLVNTWVDIQTTMIGDSMALEKVVALFNWRLGVDVWLESKTAHRAAQSA